MWAMPAPAYRPLVGFFTSCVKLLIDTCTPAAMLTVAISRQLVEPVVQVSHWKVSLQTQEIESYENYLSLEWELRFGQLDEVSLSCELDVWAVIPEDKFFLTQPETAAELARFAEGEPMLRVMTRVDIIGGTVDMERCGDDPLPLPWSKSRPSSTSS